MQLSPATPEKSENTHGIRLICYVKRAPKNAGQEEVWQTVLNSRKCWQQHNQTPKHADSQTPPATPRPASALFAVATLIVSSLFFFFGLNQVIDKENDKFSRKKVEVET